MKPLGVLLLLALVVGGCGRAARPSADVRAQGSGPAVTGEPSSTASPEAASSPGAASTRRPAARGGSDGGGFPTPGANPRNTMPLTVSLNRTCAKVGDEMAATATTLPGAQIAFSAGYADNSLIPDFTFVPKETNVTGTYTWRWVIRPMRSGPAMLSVVASKESKGAAFNVPFRVASSC